MKFSVLSQGVRRILHCLQEDADWFFNFKTFMPDVFYALGEDSNQKPSLTLIFNVSHNLTL